MKTLWFLWVAFTFNGELQPFEPVGHIPGSETAAQCAEYASYADAEVSEQFRPVKYACIETEVIEL